MTGRKTSWGGRARRSVVEMGRPFLIGTARFYVSIEFVDPFRHNHTVL